MENAAVHVAETALDLLDSIARPRVLIVCGPGSNGGDGLAAARHLHNAGVDVRLVALGEERSMSAAAGAQLRTVRAMGIEVRFCHDRAASAIDAALTDRDGRSRGPDLVIDALLGTGLSRPAEGPAADLIDAINEMGRRGVGIVSVDIPSGLDGESGRVIGAFVHASVTVTFAGLKRGLLSMAAQKHVGEIVVADIGVPRVLLARLGTPLREGPLTPEAQEGRDAGSTTRRRGSDARGGEIEPPPTGRRQGDDA